jgi:hypothetical protein
MKKYLTIFAAAVTLELLSTLYIQAVASWNMPAVAVLAFLSPLANLPFVGHLVDTKEWNERVKMALVYGTGYAVGAMIVFLIKIL